MLGCFLCVRVSAATIESPTVRWIDNAGGAGDEIGLSIATDPLGTNYLTGYFVGSATFGSTNVASSGFAEIFIAKHNPAGKLLWVKTFPGEYDNEGRGITLDGVGNVFVTGDFARTTTFGTNRLTSAGSSDLFVTKLDANGEVNWIRQHGGVGVVIGNAIAVDTDGNCFVTGLFSIRASFDAATFTALGGQDAFLAKYNAAGKLLWARQFGGTGADAGQAIAVDHAGACYVTGYFQNTLPLDSVTLTSNGTRDVFVAKFDAGGNFVWAASGGGTLVDEGRGIAVDVFGGVHVAGFFDTAARFGGRSLSSHGHADIFLAKYDTAGKLLWINSAGGSDFDEGLALGLDRGGNIFLSGVFSETATFGSVAVNSIGHADMFLAKYNPAGALKWVTAAGGNAYKTAFGLAVTPGGACFISGYFRGPTTFFDRALINRGGRDIAMARIDGAAPLPELRAEIRDGRLVVAWPDWPTPLQLESTPNLSPIAAWVGTTNLPASNHGVTTVTNGLGSGQQFFRLRQP
ncbi:MAG: SBBP repeat-containing protein [Verrucomicrobia bacterium]|nr:SBBP repeat-containing protein [Verrucomicrobiota bacterium]